MARLPDWLLEDDPVLLAPSVGLRHVLDTEPGIRRRRRGTGFSYHAPDGTLLSGRRRERCEQLAIPPAWNDVWIAPTANGYLQATGRDDADRKQHRYHEAYRELCERRKFQRLAWFGPALDALRAAVEEGLAADDPATRTHAVVVRLIDRSLIRVGGRSSAGTGARGAVSLSPGDIEVHEDLVHISYVAKGGRERDLDVDDSELAEALADHLSADDDRLFCFEDADVRREVTAQSVNEWIHEACRSPFTARDFRTWGGTVTAARALLECVEDDPRPDLRAADAAAERLGNTRAVARSAYVAPALLEAHDNGQLQATHRRTRRGRRLSRTERTVMRVLQDWVDA